MKKTYLFPLICAISLLLSITACKEEVPVIPPEEPTDGISDMDCPNDNSTSIVNIGCNTDPTSTSEYSEVVNNNVRTITSNSYPNHRFGTKTNVTVITVDKTYTVSAQPELADELTKVVRDNGRPARSFGIALNGIVFSPAPAEPFIFENTETGEFNWDWVYEPTKNQGNGSTKVALDCSSAHVNQNNGYHYHGNMFEYVKNFQSGTGEFPKPFQIGWAADGFPVLYQEGPDGSGGFKTLVPSYQLKEGLRPGDGVSEPCGSYSGKYTNDYEYVEGLGDLDECNGIAREVTLMTVEGEKTFDYFYVITNDFPQISRCLSGTPDPSF